MNFSEEWESRFYEGTHMSLWPWSDLVSLVFRHAKPSNGFQRVLEIGCGPGANVPFFVNLGVDYYAIDGSPTAVDGLTQRYPQLVDKVIVGDFTESIPFEDEFDLVVERAAMTHNSTESIQRALSKIASKLRSGGKYIGIDWFSTDHSDFRNGAPLDDNTRIDLPEGSHLAQIGPVHFSDEPHLSALFSEADMSIEVLAHKRVKKLIPAAGGDFASFDLVAVKP